MAGACMSADYPWQVVVARERISPGRPRHGMSLVDLAGEQRGKKVKGYCGVNTGD
jgi:hypothetical protein